MWDRRAEYIENYDGDSVTMILDQGFHDTKEVHLRLANVWAPEMDELGGPEVQNYVAHWFEMYNPIVTRWNFIVFTHRMKKADQEQMTFSRYVATIYSADGKGCLNSDVMKFIAEHGYGPGVQVVRNG